MANLEARASAASSSTSLNLNASDSTAKLWVFAGRRMAPHGVDAGDGGPGPTLLRGLVESIGHVVDEASWQRRPALCHDGTPIVLSAKLRHGRSDELRLLVEPGGLDRTVAQQVAFSLTTLDRLLGLLSWRAATEDINTITRWVFPRDHRLTRDWWGGIWLGASLPSWPCSTSTPDLRLYLNLRHGDAASRWRRIVGLLSGFSVDPRGGLLTDWIARVHPQAIPVGLGVVIAAGLVRAIRVYVGVAQPSLPSLLALGGPISAAGTQALADAHQGFTDRFGILPSQGVTVGYDFVRDAAGRLSPRIERVKVDVGCQFVSSERRASIGPWIERLLTEWSLDSGLLKGFVADVEATWGGCDIEFVSLGFAPDPCHITVYVKPWS